MPQSRTTSRQLDERLAKALSHPLRQRILQRLNEGGVKSPNELSRDLGDPLGNVSYHVRILRELDCVELVRTEQRRGALEHYYRATAEPWLDDEQWARGSLLALPLSRASTSQSSSSAPPASTTPPHRRVPAKHTFAPRAPARVCERKFAGQDPRPGGLTFAARPGRRDR